MKRKLLFLSGIMLCISLIGAIMISLFSTKQVQHNTLGSEKLKIVATFYPIYLIGQNLAGNSEDIEVKSLTDLNTGCLHDYQLTTEDMKLISDADVLVINGGGMEAFLEDIRVNYPNLTVIDAGEGISMLGGSNAHVWLDPERYIRQVENVRDGLLNYIDSSMDNTTLSSTVLDSFITQNAEIYMSEIKKINQEYTDLLSDHQASDMAKAIIFHDSFAYLADKAGIEVAYTIPLDSDTSLSAGDIAEIIDRVKKDKVRYLFTEEQYSDSIAKQIEAETDAKVYIIDSVVTGAGEADSYLKAMKYNLEVINDALSTIN